MNKEQHDRLTAWWHNEVQTYFNNMPKENVMELHERVLTAMSTESTIVNEFIRAIETKKPQ